MTGWFDGRAGIVTGAAGGIGRASALAFARRGGAVLVTDLEACSEEGERTVDLIRGRRRHGGVRGG
jgi:NAD(P)-dependent dehydrogenase (short-subunit alcohol dehydrogenase family)